MSTSQYLLGAAELAVIAAALGLGAYHLRALLVPAWLGALARLAEIEQSVPLRDMFTNSTRTRDGFQLRGH